MITWTKCLKSENAFKRPKLSTLAVIKKHSQINEYFVFSARAEFSFDSSPKLLLPELLASWDCCKRFWSSLYWLVAPVVAGFLLLSHSVTSSDDAWRAVNPLKQNHDQKLPIGRCMKFPWEIQYLQHKALTLASSGLSSAHILHQFYPFLLNLHLKMAHINEAWQHWDLQTCLNLHK